MSCQVSFPDCAAQEACDNAVQIARKEGDLLGIATYAQGGEKWISLVPLQGLAQDKQVIFTGFENSSVPLSHKQHYCLTRWPSSRSVKGNDAWYFAEKFKAGGEFLLEARRDCDEPVTQKWRISFHEKEVEVDPMKAVCLVTGLSLEGPEARITICTLGDSMELCSSQDVNWGQIRKEVEKKRGTQCTLRGPDGDYLNCEESLIVAAGKSYWSANVNLGGA
jgi:hypothetical protein